MDMAFLIIHKYGTYEIGLIVRSRILRPCYIALLTKLWVRANNSSSCLVLWSGGGERKKDRICRKVWTLSWRYFCNVLHGGSDVFLSLSFLWINPTTKAQIGGSLNPLVVVYRAIMYRLPLVMRPRYIWKGNVAVKDRWLPAMSVMKNAGAF